MKKLVVILVLSMGLVAGVFAQRNIDNNPKVQELRKEFYQKELQFTDSEAKAFWPLFAQFQKEQRKLRNEYKAEGNPSALSEEQLEARIQKSFEGDQKKAELKKKYYDKFSKVLPIRKVALLEGTERKFKREVIKRIRQNRRNKN